MTDIRTLYNFLHMAEKLKFELRHSFTSSGRQESVAEHTWRMALMAMLFESKLDKASEKLQDLEENGLEIYDDTLKSIKQAVMENLCVRRTR